MNIAIIGTRGIPNQYGGFEQFAEYVSAGLVEKGNSVTVYSSHSHPYKHTEWRGVKIIHCNNPENRLGKIGQFIYDLNCILDARRNNFDVILQLGYTSSSIWGWLLPRKKSIVTTNMDGLEWKRTRYTKKVQRFLKYAEKLAVNHSDYLIADSVGIQNYLKQQYQKDSIFIPYGADLFNDPDSSCLKKYNVEKYNYNMLIARLEPENSIEMILDGVVLSATNEFFLVIGKHETKFGEYLKKKFRSHDNIRFIGGIYDINVLNNLRHFSNLYFHGHTVGGTNPSLLEAMSSQALICAHDNIFNASILGSDAFYFSTPREVSEQIRRQKKELNLKMIAANEDKITNTYTWPNIIRQYSAHFEDIVSGKQR
ncbi:MAG: DUF1972 domain-containing protein [Bacteroidota bacterium]